MIEWSWPSAAAAADVWERKREGTQHDWEVSWKKKKKRKIQSWGGSDTLKEYF